MITQIIGSAKCRGTQKCRRWFDERGIGYQYVNLAKRALSATELSAIARVVSWDDMMDDQGKVWASRQLAWKEFDPLEELLAHPLLLKTPVVRRDAMVVIGYRPRILERFQQS